MERDEEDNESVRNIFLHIYILSLYFNLHTIILSFSSHLFRHHHPQKLLP